jgi:hypothetical protein
LNPAAPGGITTWALAWSIPQESATTTDSKQMKIKNFRLAMELSSSFGFI